MAKRAGFGSKLTLPAKVGIGAVLLALGAVAYVVLFYNDLAASIKTEEGRERQLRQDLDEARRAEHAYQKDLAELAERQQRQRELNKILPPTTEYPAFLSAVQNVANVANVTLVAWTPQEEVSDQFYARVPMKIELRGRFHQIAKFFYNVGQLDRIINMENISIVDPQEKNGEVSLKVEALATAFHQIEAKPGAPAGKGKKK